MLVFRYRFQQWKVGNPEENDVNYMKIDDINLRNISVNLNVRTFNPELPGSLRPQCKLEEKVMNWEEKLILSLNNINKIEKDDLKTSYLKFKLFKHDVYGLALEETGNLVKSTLVWCYGSTSLQKPLTT